MCSYDLSKHDQTSCVTVNEELIDILDIAYISSDPIKMLDANNIVILTFCLLCDKLFKRRFLDTILL